MTKKTRIRSLLSYVLKHTHGLPYLVSLQGPDVPGFEARYHYLYPFLTPFIRLMWKSASAVTAISQEQRDLAHRTLPGLSMAVIPNGVDTSAFRPSGGIHKKDSLTLLCVARLIARKGQAHLLRALAALQTKGDRSLRLVLVGTGDDHDMLEHLTVELGLRDHVEFRGFVPREQMPALYHQADVFVLPSQHEGMSIALLEAMASGLPVIVTDTGGTAELVQEGTNGHIIPWNDVPTLAEAIRKLAHDPECRRQMGTAGRQRAEEFGWRALARRYLELCERVARGLAPTQETVRSSPAPVPQSTSSPDTR